MLIIENKRNETNNPRAAEWYNRGFCTDDAKAAVRCYTKAIQLDPLFADAYYLRAHSYSGLREYKNAIDDLNKAIELKPEESQYYCARGDNYQNLHDYTNAIKDFDKAIELNPQFARAYLHRCWANFETGDHEQGKIDYEKAADLDPLYKKRAFIPEEIRPPREKREKISWVYFRSTGPEQGDYEFICPDCHYEDYEPICMSRDLDPDEVFTCPRCGLSYKSTVTSKEKTVQ